MAGGVRSEDGGRADRDESSARPEAKKAIAYPEVCTAYGSIRLAASVGDKVLVDKLIAKYASILTDNGKHLIPRPDHVDRSVFGVLPLEIYGQTHDARYLALGKNSADAQWAKTNAAGLTSQTRWWLDDMFMITALQTQAFRETKDAVYLDRAAKEMAAYVDKLQQPSGLFFHSSGPGLFYWGRANGWMAAGMAELLSELPPEHPERAKILEGYRKFMTALVKVQDADGMWHQVLDDPKAWPESSCSGDVHVCLARGVHNGWLDAGTFGEPVRKAWLALSTNYVDANGNVKEVCVGTGAGRMRIFICNGHGLWAIRTGRRRWCGRPGPCLILRRHLERG